MKSNSKTVYCEKCSRKVATWDGVSSANIEVNIDYPEYEDIYEVTMNDVSSKIDDIKKSLENIVSEYENGFEMKLSFTCLKSTFKQVKGYKIAHYKDGEITYLDTQVVLKKVSANITEGGTYFVIDENETSDSIFDRIKTVHDKLKNSPDYKVKVIDEIG